MLAENNSGNGLARRQKCGGFGRVHGEYPGNQRDGVFANRCRGDRSQRDADAATVQPLRQREPAGEPAGWPPFPPHSSIPGRPRGVSSPGDRRGTTASRYLPGSRASSSSNATRKSICSTASGSVRGTAIASFARRLTRGVSSPWLSGWRLHTANWPTIRATLKQPPCAPKPGRSLERHPLHHDRDAALDDKRLERAAHGCAQGSRMRIRRDCE